MGKTGQEDQTRCQGFKVMKILMTSIGTAFRNCKTRERVKKLFPGTVIEDNVIIKGDIKNLKLGRNVIIQSGTVLHLGGMEWCQNSGFIEIGDDSVISPNCVIYGCGPGGVYIGERFDCGPGVAIVSSRTDYSLGPNNHVFSRVRICNEVIVYANAVIGPGVVVGDRAVIAACSVVTRDIPGNTLVGGAPANIIKNGVRD